MKGLKQLNFVLFIVVFAEKECGLSGIPDNGEIVGSIPAPVGGIVMYECDEGV